MATENGLKNYFLFHTSPQSSVRGEAGWTDSQLSLPCPTAECIFSMSNLIFDRSKSLSFFSNSKDLLEWCYVTFDRKYFGPCEEREKNTMGGGE